MRNCLTYFGDYMVNIIGWHVQFIQDRISRSCHYHVNKTKSFEYSNLWEVFINASYRPLDRFKTWHHLFRCWTAAGQPPSCYSLPRPLDCIWPWKRSGWKVRDSLHVFHLFLWSDPFHSYQQTSSKLPSISWKPLGPVLAYYSGKRWVPLFSNITSNVTKQIALELIFSRYIVMEVHYHYYHCCRYHHRHRIRRYNHRHRIRRYNHRHRIRRYHHRHRIRRYHHRHPIRRYNHRHRIRRYHHRHRIRRYHHRHPIRRYNHRHRIRRYNHRHRIRRYHHCHRIRRYRVSKHSSSSHRTALFHVSPCSSYTVVLNGREAIEEALLKRAHDFADRSIMYVEKKYSNRNAKGELIWRDRNVEKIYKLSLTTDHVVAICGSCGSGEEVGSWEIVLTGVARSPVFYGISCISPCPLTIIYPMPFCMRNAIFFESPVFSQNLAISPSFDQYLCKILF